MRRLFRSDRQGQGGGGGGGVAGWLLAALTTEGGARDVILWPLAMLVLRLVGAFAGSLFLYFGLYTYLLPKALVREPVYFDFTTKPHPSARIGLLSKEKQWHYVNTKRHGLGSSSAEESGGSSLRRFLFPGFRYSVDLTFHLAKSRRNLDLGKFMVYLTMVDSSGDSIAKSARPVVVPYQSFPSLAIDSLTKYPLRLCGLYQLEETSNIRVSIMNDYREPLSAGASTEVVEMTLSTDAVDVGEVYLTIMPVLGGITFYMHYYPRASFLIGVSVLTGAQIALYVIFAVLSSIVKFISRMSDDSDERQDMDDGDYDQPSDRNQGASGDGGGGGGGGAGDGGGGGNSGSRGPLDAAASDGESRSGSTWRFRDSLRRTEDSADSESDNESESGGGGAPAQSPGRAAGDVPSGLTFRGRRTPE